MTVFPRFLLTAVAVCVLGTSLAQAQPRDQRHDQRNEQRYDQRNDPRHDPRQRGDQRRHAPPPPQAYGPGRPDYRPGGPDYRPGRGPGFQGQRGAGPNHNWHRGSRMPPAYRTNHYVVNNWRVHHLSAPPRGYHWVQNGPDYLLVAIATGVIAQLILGN